MEGSTHQVVDDRLLVEVVAGCVQQDTAVREAREVVDQGAVNQVLERYRGDWKGQSWGGQTQPCRR